MRIRFAWMILFGALGLRSETAPAAQRPHATMLSQRWNGIVRQAFDYSCGTGSIANLIALTGGTVPDERALITLYGKKRGEAVLNQAMKEGFSLLDLKLMLGFLGYTSAGMRYDAGTMPDDAQPMIVYLVVKGYKHFAVFAGVERGQVILLDPSRGRIRITQERFVAEWDGTALMLDKATAVSLPKDEWGLTHAQEAARSGFLSGRQ